MAVKNKKLSSTQIIKKPRRKADELARALGAIALFVKEKRKELGYTQSQLAFRSGVGLRFLKELETGKTSLRMDKVNQVLAFFGAELAPTSSLSSKRESTK